MQYLRQPHVVLALDQHQAEMLRSAVARVLRGIAAQASHQTPKADSDPHLQADHTAFYALSEALRNAT